MTHEHKAEGAARRGPLPPGPGSLHMVKVLLSLSRQDLVELARKYGDPLTIPTPLGPMVTTISPEGNKAIFTTEPDTFVPSVAESFGAVLKSSVLFQHGAEHRRARKLLAPPFHGARMSAYGNLMRDAARHWAQQWEVGKPFTMLATTQAITLDVILRAVFGVSEKNSSLTAQLRQEVLGWIHGFSPFIFLKPLRRDFGGLGPWARFQRNHNQLRQRVLMLIAEHRAALTGREDVLSLLLSVKDEQGNGLSDDELVDQLVTMVLAGHETTAVMLAWAFYLLHRHPPVLARLRAELGTLPDGERAEPEAIARLPFLEAVCNETLRLYPPAHVIHRRLVRPLALLGWELPVGTIVGAGVYATHRLPSLYPQPEQFQPERFLDRTFSPFEFLPWGGGARRCLGAPFALYEMKLVLAALLRDHRLKLLETSEVKLAHRAGTVGPKGGIRMALESRG